MSTRQYVFGLVILVVFASFLIFYKLGQVPHGMTWDEAAIGYNGYAVVTTRRDEWLERLPISFRSFGDYKAPLGIYLNGVFTLVLGMQLWVVRLPFALASVVSIVGMVLLVEQLLRRNVTVQIARSYALAAGALLLTEPWFLHFARVGFEAGLALTFLIWGSLGLVVILSRSSPQKWISREGMIQGALILGTALGLAASVYSYHASKVVVPLVSVLLIGLVVGRRWVERWRELLVLGLMALLFLGPLLKDLLWGSGGERFQQTTLFNRGLLPGELAQALISHFVAHLDPRFIVGGSTPTLRHGDGIWGVLLPPVAFLVLSGLVLLGVMIVRRLAGARKLVDVTTGDTALLVAGWLWVLIGLAPAVVGVDVPHSNRALLALPGLLLVVVVACRWWWSFLKRQPLNHTLRGSHGERNLLLKSAVGTFALLQGLFFIAYQHNYYTAFAQASAVDFKDGYLEAFAFVEPYEKGEGQQAVDKVLFTNDYGQPYIYALFVRRTNPIWYQGGSLVKYEFSDTITAGDLERENTIVVGSATDELPLDEADKVIYGSDGEVKFKIYVRQ